MRLILLPNLLDPEGDVQELSPKVKKEVERLDGLIAESEKSARRYLRYFLKKEKCHIPIRIFNEHTQEIDSLILPILKGETWGLISDAGLPCIADPGAKLVALLKEKGVLIAAISGPSSIFLALMLSGFCGQRFCFHGYLPRKQDLLKKKLQQLETLSFSQDSTQIFIETPYRSKKVFLAALSCLKKDTFFCVAKDLTMPTQQVISKKIASWQKISFHLQKKAAVFLIYRKSR